LGIKGKELEGASEDPQKKCFSWTPYCIYIQIIFNVNVNVNFKKIVALTSLLNFRFVDSRISGVRRSEQSQADPILTACQYVVGNGNVPRGTTTYYPEVLVHVHA